MDTSTQKAMRTRVSAVFADFHSSCSKFVVTSWRLLRLEDSCPFKKPVDDVRRNRPRNEDIVSSCHVVVVKPSQKGCSGIFRNENFQDFVWGAANRGEDEFAWPLYNCKVGVKMRDMVPMSRLRAPLDEGMVVSVMGVSWIESCGEWKERRMTYHFFL